MIDEIEVIDEEFTDETSELVEMVERVAMARKQLEIQRTFINEAVRFIRSGKINVGSYKSDDPVLNNIYEISSALYEISKRKATFSFSSLYS